MKRVFRVLKKYLIPHEGNDHKPHLLRPQTVVFVIGIALVIESCYLFGTSYLAPRSKLFGIVVVNTLIDGTNAARAASHLPPLAVNPLLSQAATEKAADMAQKNYFAHTSPEGITPWYWFGKVGYEFAAAGENLAVNFSDSADVTKAWLNSPAHRDNILNAGFSEIGMAVAEGEFQGHRAIYVVELFGTPASSFALAPAPALPAAPVSEAAPSPKTSPAPRPLALERATDTFVMVKGAEAALAQAAETTSVTRAPRQAGVIQNAFADPRRTADYFYFGILVLFAAALALNVFIKIHIQHPRLILGGMLVIAVAGLFMVLNQHFGAFSVVVL